MLRNPDVLLSFDKVHNPLRLPCETTSETPKVVRTPGVLNILTLKCASRHNGVHFFDISTSKSGLDLVCFVHFDLEMCFAPQRRALFRHLNCQKWSGPGVFCTFWLRNVLRATTACNFPSLIWPAGSAPAAFASLLFDPPEPQIIKKNTASRDFPTFSRTWIFFLLLFSLLLFSLLLFLFSLDPFHLCFSSVHIVGSLTSKLPSMKWKYLKLVVSEELENWILNPVLTFGAHSARKGGPRTIHAEGCAGLIYSHLTTRLCVRHARSPQRVARNQDKFAFHHTFVHLTRAISAEGRVSQFGFSLPLLP